jgi:HD-GYP domain-containing protein (c-di-GMP phosphodiesterase class II)
MKQASRLTLALAVREPDEAAHAARVTAFAVELAEAVGAGSRRVGTLRVGGPLHDVGKLALDRELLRKPGPLAEDELEELQTHPERGVELLDGDSSVARAFACVLHHHERWDGGGYPYGLAGEQIPLEARILAVVDAFDAMTSDRAYRSAAPADVAIAEVERCAGSQFDPQLAEAFVALRHVG